MPKASAEGVKMRIVVINPSSEKTQTKDVKKYLPKEVSLKDIRDAGGMDVEYDEQQGLFYMFKTGVELAPLETKTFEVIVEDVWIIPDEELNKHKISTEKIMAALKDTIYYAQADLIAKLIYGRLSDIGTAQKDPSVTRQQHIANHRDHLAILEQIKSDIEKLEKILVAVGGPPNLELIEESDINLKSPSSKTTWIIIFIVLIFIAILAGTFFFTWHRQAAITESVFKSEKDNSFSEFKDGGQAGESPPPGQEKKP